MAEEHWKDEPDAEDYPSAESYLSLLVHPRGNNTDVISWRDATSPTQTPSR